MDPSAFYCLYRDSFAKESETPIGSPEPYTYSSSDFPENSIEKEELGSPIYSSSTEKSHSKSKETVVSKSLIENNQSLFDPFHKVSFKPFLSRDSITLANTDAVFNLTQHFTGYILKQDTDDFSFATLEDGPGHFTQYIMYRKPNSYGYGITPIDYPFDGEIDITHFNITLGASGKGNLEKDYRSFVRFVKSVEVTGVDLVAGNYTDNGKITPTGYLVRLLAALGTIKIDGNFVCKIGQLDHPLMQDLVWVTSKCFREIALFKPISTPSYDQVYYLVGKNANINNIEWIGFLDQTYTKSVKQSKTIEKLFSQALPTSLVQWLEGFQSIESQYLNYLKEKSERDVKYLYDTYKCKAIWNLPDL